MPNNNPQGINQYSGGGKGGKKITMMDPRTGYHSQITRDTAATRVKFARKDLRIVKGEKAKAQLKATIGNIRYAAKKTSAGADLKKTPGYK